MRVTYEVFIPEADSRGSPITSSIAMPGLNTPEEIREKVMACLQEHRTFSDGMTIIIKVKKDESVL